MGYPDKISQFFSQKKIATETAAPKYTQDTVLEVFSPAYLAFLNAQTEELIQLYSEFLDYYSLDDLELLQITEIPANTPEAYYFDQASALRVLIFFPKFLVHGKGAVAGKPFRLGPWQIKICWEVYGWLCYGSNDRRFRQVWVEIARKNGKTDFGGGILIFEAIAMAVRGGEFYIIAKDEDQSKIMYDRIYEMIEDNPELKRHCVLNLKAVWIKDLRAVIRHISGNPKGKHGKHTTALMIDEAHEIVSDELYSVMHKGGTATKNYIEWFFTTAGERKGWGFEKHQYMQKILDGVVDINDSIYIQIFTTDPDADPSDEEVWKQANPQLDLSVERRFLREEYLETIGNPRLEAYFWMYHLNVWTEGAAKWLDLNMWDKCTAKPKGMYWQDLEFDLLGRECYGGLDLATTSDLCALVWVFPPENKHDYDATWHVLCRFWMPADNVRPRIQQDNVPYDRLIRAGAIQTTPGNITNYRAIKRQILADMGNFNVKAIGVDRFNSSQLVLDLMDELGEDEYGEDIVQRFGQGFVSMSSPSYTLERLVLGGMLEHGGNPALRWQAGNVRVKMDDVDNIKPTKQLSVEKIDGIVASIMAIGMAQHEPPEELPDTYINSHEDGMVVLQ